AALTIAGLCAEGCTTVENINFIDRGYESLEKSLDYIGAKIKRID
ncbi:MAG TPA: UDP-N-acetylglucosamine 1-carboxyvinyltransferase, partial [Ruminococcaceae bacterium]|nr:UDP-N-acetylglucosamine 1-carboxyvinyltransferase [Oscillospiraceae bacterium]